MQIISSMLGLQSAYVEDQRLNEVLKDSQNRIKSMALIHEKLYQSNNMANINFPEYINSLISNIENSYSFKMDKVRINKHIEDICFNIDIAIPLGLVINEIITNSYKHAFPNGLEGEINLEIINKSDGEYVVTINDNGIGLPPGFDINNSKSLGLQLVNVLVDQINGHLIINNEKGLSFTIIFHNN